MISVPTDTAILLFAHAAEHEAKTKSFSSGGSTHINQKVANALIRHTLTVIRKSAIPLFTVFTDQQRGGTFGERLANAFQDAFEAGYLRVICIGSDCPTLRVSDLLQAREALQQQPMVVGPARDGGAYLIGMHIDCFDPEAFAMLNWQTGKVLQELSLYSFRQQARLNGFELLRERADIDSNEDLTLILQQLPVLNRLRQRILSILTKCAAQAYKPFVLFFFSLGQHIDELLLRAPPL